MTVVHPVQHGLPPDTVALWKEIDRQWGARILGLQAWGNAAHKLTRSDHNDGYAVDVMTPDFRLQDEIVTWATSHHENWHLSYVISRRRIWSTHGGWKPKAYTGPSPHTDHVHISVQHPFMLDIR
jgi:hypothetical protein